MTTRVTTTPRGRQTENTSSSTQPDWEARVCFCASDGSGVDVPLANFEKSEANSFTVASWSRADVLIFNVLNKNGDMDLWTLSMSGDRTRRAFVSSKQSELNGTFSPDGRWVAYQSNASNRYEIVVRPFPNKAPRELFHVMAGSIPAGGETARSFSSCRPPGR
jgi:WD40-like Beta Propeller Repeat